MYLLINGKIVTEERILEGYELLIEGDSIKRIEKSGELERDGIEVVDVDGAYISPGFIDIHADYIENMSAPRPTSMMDFDLSIREAEKVLINTGITTMFHSLSLYGKDLFETKPIRRSENVDKLIAVISRSHNEKHLIRHRFHARFEIDNLNGVDQLRKYIKEGKVHLLSFMDHTPGQGQYRDIEMYRKTLKGYRYVTDNEIDNIVRNSQEKEKLTVEMIESIAELARENNIAIASHDDDSEEKINFIKTLGASISEFPITMEVAKKARKEGLLTVAGAPNVLLGGSHSGNLSAAEAVLEDEVDILCSDYYPAAMLHSIFILNEKYNRDLCEMFKLVTINPAKAVNIDNYLGSIKEGKKADLLVIEKLDNNIPVITSVFVDGKLISKTNYRI
ncbi:phosphonate metabolism protein PhnM [Clostridium paraputrificum]|uniref:phosphonate metabolism protein PhnM n=1 Tax=Clostridium paraputrificum TaxID=29363 RepID=UPI003D34D292